MKLSRVRVFLFPPPLNRSLMGSPIPRSPIARGPRLGSLGCLGPSLKLILFGRDTSTLFHHIIPPCSHLKILLVFLCEAAVNQLQQSKGCCGVSHVLGFVQRSKSCTGICVLDWLVTYLGVVHQKGKLSLQNKSNCVLE